MATNFPASLDTLTNPTSSDSLSSPSHSAQHANVNDAVEALQAKVGVDSSAVTTSLDYKVAQLETFGAWQTYSPSCSWSGQGSFDFVKYAQVNKTVYLMFYFTLTGTPSVTFEFDQPFVEVTGESPAGTSGTAMLSDATGNNYIGFIYMTGTQVRITTETSGGVDATAPFTWASGDSIRGLMIYEAA